MPYVKTDDQDVQLKKFRITHAYKQLDVAGICWEYIACGRGENVLLLLPGAHGLGEVAFQIITRFEHTYRIISPSYPSGVRNVAGLVDGLVDILNAEHITQAYVVGGSFSGMVAQQLVRRHSEKVSKLVLDHAGIPRTDRARTYIVLGAMIAFLPLALTRTLLSLGKYLYLRGMTTHRVFWDTYFAEIIATLTKEDYLSRIQVCIDFDRNSTLTCNDLRDWPGSMLIIEADDDAYVPPKEREGLKAIYPQARMHTFHGTSHFAWATDLDEFLEVIEHFLQETT